MSKTKKAGGYYLPAKTCFSHIGGKLGHLLMEQFVEKGWIEKQKSR